MLTRTAFQEKEQKFSPWLLALIFTFCFVPKLIVKIPVLNAIFIVGAVFSFAYMSASLIIHKEKPTLATIMLVAYQASFGLQTLLGSGDILMWGYLSLTVSTIAMAIQHFSKTNATLVLRTLIWLFAAYLTIHFVIGIFYKNGVVDDMGFIGIRTRLTDIIFPALTLTLLLDHKMHRMWSHRTIYLFILSVYLVIYHNVVAALLGILVMGVAWLGLVLIRWKHLGKVINVWTILLMGVVANVLIVFMQITLRMSWFFETFLGRSGDLSFRTDIWNSSFPIVKEKLFFGHGVVDNGNFVPRPNFEGGITKWQAHNQCLQTLHDGGIFALLILLAFLIICYILMTKQADRYTRACQYAALIGFVVMMTVEIFTYTPYFFVLPLTAACTCCNDVETAGRKSWSLPWFQKKSRAEAVDAAHIQEDSETEK